MPAPSFDLQAAYNWIEAQCNAANVRYDQTYRNMRTVNGLTYFDCSSLMFFGLWLGGGFDVGLYGYSETLTDYTNPTPGHWANAWTVQTMEPILVSAGWVDVRLDMPEEWLPGDILIKYNQWHTEMVYSPQPNLMQMGARTSKLPDADQVAIHTLYTGYYDRILRDPTQPPPTPGPGPHPGPTKRMPIWLIKRAKQLNGGDLG